jgi:type IV pilus assembly protein PilB
MPVPSEILYKLLIDSGYLEEKKLKKALTLAKHDKISLSEAIISLDLLSDENIGSILADYFKLPFVNLSKVAIPEPVLRIIPEKVAQKQKAIAFDHNKQGIKVAMADPNQTELLELISQKTGHEVLPYYSTERLISDSFRLYKKDLQKSFNELLKQEIDQAGKAIQKDLPVSKIVNLLIEYSYEDKASDIHIEPEEESSLVRFRIDGVLHDMVKLPRSLHDQVVTRIKVLSRLRTDEHLSAQDGKMQIDLVQEKLDVRVSIVPIVEGEKVVLRLLSSKSRQFSLRDLGMNEIDLEKVRSGFTKPYGMVLSTGPTGSGKTTSIYSILKILNTREKNIATIEDPVEYEIDGINQIQVNAKTNLTFADGLRAILRQDPNIIFVGEIRDDETASIAVNAALTGHLVLSTLHTNDSATALPRLIDMSIEPFLVSSTVNVIIAQRLIRKICEMCRVSITTEAAELENHFGKEITLKHFGDSKTVRMYHGKGCEVCHHTGYQGRIGIFEVLEITPAIQELISKKADSDVILAQAIKEGMTTMIDDGLDKIQQGITSIEEVLRAVKAS